MSITYFLNDKTNLKIDLDTFEKQSFLEKSIALNKMNSNSLLQMKTSSKNSKKFKATVYLFKDIDPIEEKPQVWKATVKLSDSFEIFENQKLTHKISFLEYKNLFLYFNLIFIFHVIKNSTKIFFNMKKKINLIISIFYYY